MSINLTTDKNGKIMNTSENFLTIFREDETFKNCRYNLIKLRPETLRTGDTAMSAWTDVDEAAAKTYIEATYGIYSLNKFDDAIKQFFGERSYNPIKYMIESVQWDGIERIPFMLQKWLKADATPYVQEVSRLIFAGGINRLYNPGCKFDDVPILVGVNQGEGKSTFVRWLALKDDFFAEVSEFDGQKGIEILQGNWICELSELLAMTRAKEVEAIKSYLTRLTDKYRLPYDKYTSEIKRGCIFIGTTNKEQFLTDKTGNRRFYPVSCHSKGSDLFDQEKSVKYDILQCWAEALYLYKQGKMIPAMNRELTAEIKEAQSAAVEEDYRVGIIEKFLEKKDMTCVIEIYNECLSSGDFDTKPSRKDSNDIVSIMNGFKDWEKEGYAIYSIWGKQRVFVKKPARHKPDGSVNAVTDLNGIIHFGDDLNDNFFA